LRESQPSQTEKPYNRLNEFSLIKKTKVFTNAKVTIIIYIAKQTTK